MESLLSSPDLDSAIWSITLNVGPQNMGLVLRIWTFDLEHHGGTFIFSRPESVIWTFERNSSSELLLQHHRNQEDGNGVVQVNKDDTTQSVLCTNPEPHVWSWKFYPIPERIPPHWALVGGGVMKSGEMEASCKIQPSDNFLKYKSCSNLTSTMAPSRKDNKGSKRISTSIHYHCFCYGSP